MARGRSSFSGSFPRHCSFWSLRSPDDARRVTRAGASLPEPIVPDARPADSSPAPDPTPAAPVDALDALSESDLQAWRMDGKLPSERTPAPPAATPAAPAVQDPPASTDAPVPAAASEPAKPAKGAEARIPELLADRAKERDRAERAERRLAELEQRPPSTPGARPAASPPASTDLVKPDPTTFAYGAADPDYIEALTDYKVAASLATDRAAREAEQAQARMTDESRRLVASFEAKAAKAREAHADFDDVALKAPTEIPQGSPTDLWVLEDEAGAEILYHLQQPANAAERQRILALSPRDQLKELVRLGDRLTAPPPAPRSTQAPPPAPALGSRATPADPVERALAAGTDDSSTGAYIEAANRRDLARMKR